MLYRVSSQHLGNRTSTSLFLRITRVVVRGSQHANSPDLYRQTYSVEEALDSSLRDALSHPVGSQPGFRGYLISCYYTSEAAIPRPSVRSASCLPRSSFLNMRSLKAHQIDLRPIFCSGLFGETHPLQQDSALSYTDADSCLCWPSFRHVGLEYHAQLYTAVSFQ